MAKTAGKTRPKIKPIQAQIVHSGTGHHGYSSFLMSQGIGQKRIFWWMCGACWSDTSEEPIHDKESVSWELAHHLMVCPGNVSSARIQIVWADGHPTTNVRI